jgi:hypothetical protein
MPRRDFMGTSTLTAMTIGAAAGATAGGAIQVSAAPARGDGAVSSRGGGPKSVSPLVYELRTISLRIGAQPKLVHDYLSVDFETIWGIVERDLPGLEAAVKHLLSEAEPSP